jgi:hypothetical protein
MKMRELQSMSINPSSATKEYKVPLWLQELIQDTRDEFRKKSAIRSK